MLINSIVVYYNNCVERFSSECLENKTKPITYQLDYSANLKL